MWLLAASVLLGALRAGSAQLLLSGTSIVEKNDCNETVVLPCYVTNLIQNNENVMFVTWTRQGIIIFSYHGGTKKVNTHPLFSSARLLSPPELIKGVASLVMDSEQATVGNYSCKVTESNREGKIRMQLITGPVVSCGDETSKDKYECIYCPARGAHKATLLVLVLLSIWPKMV